MKIQCTCTNELDQLTSYKQANYLGPTLFSKEDNFVHSKVLLYFGIRFYIRYPCSVLSYNIKNKYNSTPDLVVAELALRLIAL